VSLEEISEGCFRSPKAAEDASNLLKESIPKSSIYTNKWAVKGFATGKLIGKLKFLRLIWAEPLSLL